MDILLVDDDKNSRNSVAKFLRQIGHNTIECDSAQTALREYASHEYPMVLSDIRMPGMSGLELLRMLSTFPNEYSSDIVLFTGYADAESAVEALKAGAYDYLLKPVNAEKLAAIVEKIEKHQILLREQRAHEMDADPTVTSEPQPDIHNQYVCAGVEIGVFSAASRENVNMALRYHQDPSLPVLIEGPTGTGKEIIAKLIHFGGDNSDKVITPFVDINCATLSHTLFESELFGYEANAFTGSSKIGQKGKLDTANGGTLFLDELEALPLHLQGKLLRVIQEKEFYRVGGLKKIKVDVRIVCATNVELTKKIEDGSFRSDLYYRLKVGHIKLSPLSKRSEEIIPLTSIFLKEFSRQKKKHFQHISEEAANIFLHHTWDGNIRELRNVVEWVVFMFDDTELKAEHLSTFFKNGVSAPVKNELSPHVFSMELRPEGITMEEFKREVIQKVLEMHNGNRSATARYLGISRRSLIDQLKKNDENDDEKDD